MKNWSARQREALLPKGGSGLELAGVAPGAHFPHRDAGPALLSYTRPARSWYVPGPCQPFELRVCGKGTMSLNCPQIAREGKTAVEELF